MTEGETWALIKILLKSIVFDRGTPWSDTKTELSNL